MKYIASLLLISLAGCAQAPFDPTDTRVPDPDSLIIGAPALAPAGCSLSRSRICQLGTELRLTPPVTRRAWESANFVAPIPPAMASRIGTIDGASITRAVWGIIGLPYDPVFLRPSILHDHYT